MQPLSASGSGMLEPDRHWIVRRAMLRIGREAAESLLGVYLLFLGIPILQREISGLLACTVDQQTPQLALRITEHHGGRTTALTAVEQRQSIGAAALLRTNPHRHSLTILLSIVNLPSGRLVWVVRIVWVIWIIRIVGIDGRWGINRIITATACDHASCQRHNYHKEYLFHNLVFFCFSIGSGGGPIR